VRGVLRALFLALSLAQPVAAQGDVNVSLDQARALAVQSLSAGNPKLAIRIAKGLLKADPKDRDAYMLLTAGYAQLGRPAAARKAAARAYRFSDSKAAKLNAADIVARTAMAENKPTLTQLWLRRAALHAENEDVKKLIARDYARVRQINPFGFRIRTSVQPSNNVNNGADSALQVIDGNPDVVGILSPSAQALSGTVATFDTILSYRLGQTDRSETRLGGRLYTRQVYLSSEAEEKAPEAENSDFGSTYAELSLKRAQAWGEDGRLGYGAAIGRSWYADEESFDFARLTLDRGLPLNERNYLSFDSGIEHRWSAYHAVFDETRLTLGTRLSHKLENGDRFGVSLALQHVDGDHVNTLSRSATVRGTYSFAKQLGPAQVSASLTLGISDFPDYTPGLGIEVPGGREDKSVYGDVSFFFSDYDYAGFAPTLRIRTGRRDSNVSRFDTNETSISLEIQSAF